MNVQERPTKYPLKVAYVVLHFPYLTETFVAEEIRSLRALGADVRIISLLDPGAGPVQPVSEELLPFCWYAPGLLSFGLWRAQVHFVVQAPGRYLGILVHLLRQPLRTKPLMWLARRLVLFVKGVSIAYSLKDDDFQLLHAHFGAVGGAAAWVASLLVHLPLTVTLVAYDIYSAGCKDLLPLVCSHASQIVTISDYNRQHLASVAGCSSEEVTVIPHGVDLASMPRAAHSESRHSMGDAVRILSVGSYITKKGHQHLIDACHLLKEQGVDFTCTFIGGGSGESAMRSRVEAYGLQQQIEILGALPHEEIIAAYLQHDLFVLASVISPAGDRDGIPVVLMEAGAVGLPLISTQVSGIPELVKNGQTGLLVPPGDASSLAEAVATLAADPALRARLGLNARNLVAAEFSAETNTQRLVALLENVARAANCAEPGPDGPSI